jgi:hypothetical protein
MGGGGVWRLGDVHNSSEGIDGMNGSASALAPPGLLRKADSKRVCSGEVACCRSGVTVISWHI